MRNQNRARKNGKPARIGTQGEWPLSQGIGCREIKIVTVREEWARPGHMGNRGFDAPQMIAMFWNAVIARSPWFHEDKEHLVCLCLDTRYRLKSFSLVSMGSLNETIAHPREIFRPAIVDSAHSIIVAHNHPSGDPHPSFTDAGLTGQLCTAGEVLEIPLLDHVIVGDGRYFSFHEHCRSWPPSPRDLRGIIPSTKRRPQKRKRHR